MGKQFSLDAKTILIMFLFVLLMADVWVHLPHNPYLTIKPFINTKEIIKTDLGTELSYNLTDCVTGEIIREVKKPYMAKLLTAYKDLDKGKENHKVRQNDFVNIFKKHKWVKPRDPGYEDVQASGTGSLLTTTWQAKASLTAAIAKVKQELGKEVIRMLDIPCGDMVWMNEYLKDRNDVNYLGLDIVPDLIEKHKVRYRQRKNLRFKHHDIVQTPISESFDLIFSRHMTQHLSSADTLAVLKHLSESGSKFLLITDYPTTRNAKLRPDRYHAQNLSLDPYRLGLPTCMSPDGLTWLSLYRLPLLRVTSNNTIITKHKGEAFLTCV